MPSSPMNPPDEAPHTITLAPGREEGTLPTPPPWLLLGGPPFAAGMGGLLAAWLIYLVVVAILLGYTGIQSLQGIDSEIRRDLFGFLMGAAYIEFYAGLVGGVVGAAGGLLLGMVLVLWRAIRPVPAFLRWSRRGWLLLGGAIGLAIPGALLLGLTLGDPVQGSDIRWAVEDVLSALWFVAHGLVGGLLAGMLFFGLSQGRARRASHAPAPPHNRPD